MISRTTTIRFQIKLLALLVSYLCGEFWNYTELFVVRPDKSIIELPSLSRDFLMTIINVFNPSLAYACSKAFLQFYSRVEFLHTETTEANLLARTRLNAPISLGFSPREEARMCAAEKPWKTLFSSTAFLSSSAINGHRVAI